MEIRPNGESFQQMPTSQPDDYLCQRCGAVLEAEVVNRCIGEPGRTLKCLECPDCRDKREPEEAVEREELLCWQRDYHRDRWRLLCGIPGHLLDRSTFKTFGAGYQDKALNNCLKYAKGFEVFRPEGYRSLVLYSPRPGVGKTHLMVALANHVIDHESGNPDAWSRDGCPIRFEKGPGLVLRVRSTYGVRDRDRNHEREEDIYKQLRGVALLLLDDVGKEKPSDFTRQLYWTIIDERVTSGLPVVLTCRLPLDSLADLMGEDTVDRLYGMTGGQIETLTGESYRRLRRVA